MKEAAIAITIVTTLIFYVKWVRLEVDFWDLERSSRKLSRELKERIKEKRLDEELEKTLNEIIDKNEKKILGRK